jgi:hypothetical protein
MAVVLRALIISDALNPWRDDGSLADSVATPFATPNPDFQAPTLDVGNPPSWQGTDRVTVLLLGVRNAARNPSRSLATVGLIAFATFVLVTVSSMKQRPPLDSHDRASGTGGFQLVLETVVRLLGKLRRALGRDVLAVMYDTYALLDRARFVGLRKWAGQDASCLNITQPTSPTILGVPRELMAGGRFTFARRQRPSANPWELLDESIGDAVPVIADDETARYILKLDIGNTLGGACEPDGQDELDPGWQAFRDAFEREDGEQGEERSEVGDPLKPHAACGLALVRGGVCIKENA